jgi:hypothetical protein
MLLPMDCTRCMGETPACSQRENCARHRDIPNYGMLSWACNLNVEGDEHCAYYIPYSQFGAN